MTTTMHTIFSRLTILAAGTAALALATASCSKTSVDGESLTAGNGEYVMTVDPTVEGTRSAADSRATLINGAAGLQGQGFGMSVYNGSTAVYSGLSMKYNSGWAPESGATLKWPGNTVYTFCAWSPASLSGSGNPLDGKIKSTGFDAFTYSGIADQEDIMLGYYQGTGVSDGTNCAAPIKFSHPLASVQFKVGAMTGLSIINSVKISGVLPQGTCTVTTACPPTYSWSDITGTAVTLTQSGLTVSPTSGTAIGTPFLVLPQALSSNNITVTLNVTPTTGSAKNITLTLDSGTLAPGKTTVYNINYDGLTTSFLVSVTNWTANDGGTVTVDEKQS